jgi:hypothetical protein
VIEKISQPSDESLLPQWVYKHCPYIKVTVHFKTREAESSALGEDPDDTIESLSKPFPALSAMTDVQSQVPSNDRRKVLSKLIVIMDAVMAASWMPVIGGTK